MKRAVRYAVVGGIGFTIDTGLTLALLSLDFPPVMARLPSFCAALVATFWLNKQFVFKTSETQRLRPVRYVLASGLGAASNFAFYMFAEVILPSALLFNLFALTMSALIGLVVSYSFNLWLYKR